MDRRPPSRLRSPLGPRVVVGLVTALCLVAEAGAVVTITAGYTGNRSVTMRVGTPTAGSVDTVQFNVDGATVGNSQTTAAASVNGNGSAVAASSGGVVAAVSMSVPNNRVPQSMTTTVTSPVSLTCIAGGCVSATIPFSAISWVVTPAPTGPNAAFDFQSGAFTGGSTQTLIAFTLQSAGTFSASSTLSFSYANTTAFPAGTYSGTVTYTATLP